MTFLRPISQTELFTKEKTMGVQKGSDKAAVATSMEPAARSLIPERSSQNLYRSDHVEFE